MALIHLAAEDGDLVEVMWEVQQDPTVVNSIDEDHGETALHLVCQQGYVQIINYLLDHGADINATRGYYDGATALHMACKMNKFEVVIMLITRGADPTIRNIHGWTPLMCATMSGTVGMVRYLVSDTRVRNGINAQDAYGQTALEWGASFGRSGIIKVLLGAGADPMMADCEGRTPMDLAKKQKADRSVRLLKVSQSRGNRRRRRRGSSSRVHNYGVGW